VDDGTLGLKVIYDPMGRRMADCEHAADALDIVRALNAWHAGDWQAAPMVVETIEGEEGEDGDVVEAVWQLA
jgi:hypothetical protein